MANEAEIIASNILSSAIEYKRLYDQTKNNEYKVKEQRLRRIAENVKLLLSSTSTSSVNSFNGRTGAVVLTSADVTTALGYTPPTNLNGLTDVTLSAPANGQVLTYNSTTSQWENQTPAGGGGGGDMLKSTYDVDNDGTVDSAERIEIIVRNSTGSTLTKGQVVYLSGATGNRPNALLSQAHTEATSSKTIGIVVADITNNSDGYVAVNGTLHDLDTSAFTAGDAVWLSATTAGAYTSTIPAEPNHTVFIGYIARSHPTQGRLVILIQNGYELNELHGVLISSEANNDLLVYESSTSLWKNKTISTIFGGTPLVSVPTLAQVTTAGNTTTNAITVGGLTVATNLIYTDTVNGRVGIGTTGLVPGFLLTINGSVSISAGQSLTLDPSAGIYMVASSSQFRVYTGAIAALSIANTGNVLINTTTDAGYKLDVNGTTRMQGAVVFSNSSISNLISLQSSTSTSFIWQGNNTSLAYQQNNLNIQPYTGSLGVHISNLDGTTILYAKASTTGDSAVGVGTMNPLAKFHVTGSKTAASALAQGVYFNNTLVAAANNDVLVGLDIAPTFTNGAFTGVSNIGLRVSGQVLFNAYGAYNTVTPTLRIENVDTNNVAIQIKGNVANYKYYWIYDSQTTEGIYKSDQARIDFYGGTNVGFTFRNNYGRLFTIVGSTGNVLIGTTTDAGYKLDVNGTARVGNDFTIDNNRYLKAYRWTNADTSLPLQLESNSTYNVTGINFISYNNSLLNNTKSLFTFGLASPITTQSSGSVDVANVINIVPEINFANGTHTVRGIYYNPTLTSLTGTTHRAIETTSGDVIFNGGNVGIGTSSPTDKIHIVDNTNGNKFGRISAGGTNASAAWVAQNDQVDNVVYRVFGSAVTGTQMGISLARSASLMANLGGSGKFLVGTYSSTDFVMGTGNQERMRLVDTTGNFLIGTTADNGNKLQVSGSIDSTGYSINNIAGYTGLLMIPGNPPGMQNIDIQGGIIVNIF